MRAWIIVVALMHASLGLAADPARLAVASNFRVAALALHEAHQVQGGEAVSFSFASTGKHYAQIVNGAPFDAFLAADAERPEQLERDGKTVPGSRFTYATGRLALWSPQRSMTNGEALQSLEFERLAIANPRLAPYGRAAMEVLQALGIDEATRDRLVMGENVNQAFQFVHSENADLGLVAWAQVVDRAPSSYWLVPSPMHQAIHQQAILLTDSQAAIAFLQFMQQPAGRDIIRRHGYETADDR